MFFLKVVVFLRWLMTMTCDYDNDSFIQRPKLQLSVKAVMVMVNGHGQKVIVPLSRVKM